MRGAVNELFHPMVPDHVTVVDQDGLDLDSNEEDHIQISLHWPDEDGDAVKF